MPDGVRHLGDVRIDAILDLEAAFPIEDAFGPTDDRESASRDTLVKRFPEDFTAGAWRFRDRCFLIRSPGSVVLVDAGSGPIDSSMGRYLGVAGVLPDALAALRVTPDDVDHVVLTHMHSDHIGWSTRPQAEAFVPRFPNARYYLHAADVEAKRTSDDEDDVRELSEIIEPLIASGQLDTSSDDLEIVPGLRLHHAPGHTPGHRVALLEVEGERVLFCGDLLHFTLQLNDVASSTHGDRDPDAAAKYRAVWLDRVEAEGMTLASAHVPPAALGRLVRENGARRLRPWDAV
ncbi:MAG TPA: MBL fold metallo-hydrolase [Actinomycetota bacterium]|jgi:glyoxylase-like metal-dependent hydrolase (beta-lactamase superfamily II)